MKDNSDHLYGGPSGQSVLLGHQKDSFAERMVLIRKHKNCSNTIEKQNKDTKIWAK
jgi:hypothetical protein